MSELVEWLSAQLDADDAVAHDFINEGDWQAWAAKDMAGPRRDDEYAQLTIGAARVLVEVEAKRAIVAKYVRAEVAFGQMVNPASSAAVMVLAEVLQHMATVYADAPGFDETWRP